MAEEAGQFSAADALDGICTKLIRRHPHVFGGESVEDAEAVQKNWSRIKAQEKPSRGFLDGVPRSLPALHRARRVSEKAAGVGFDWPDALQVLDKVEEECAELRQALGQGSREMAEEELGDLLFALVNLGRHLEIDPERSLHLTTEKFLRRFARVEQALKAEGRHPSEVSTGELDRLWNEAKKAERTPE
jgi:MazG family protein